jgi:hypothetical protein
LELLTADVAVAAIVDGLDVADVVDGVVEVVVTVALLL